MFKKWQITMAVILMILGIMFSFQFKTQQTLNNDLNKQKTEDLLSIAANLNSKNYDLVRQQAELKTQLESLKKNGNEGETLYASLQKDMDNLEIALGTKPVKGDGIVVTFPETVNVALEDIYIIVNDLWNAGAEAISINGIRINYWTALGFDKEHNVATINNKPVEIPLEIRAIGPADNLTGALNMPERPVYFYKQIGNSPEIKQEQNLILNAVTEKPQFFTVKTR